LICADLYNNNFGEIFKKDLNGRMLIKGDNMKKFSIATACLIIAVVTLLLIPAQIFADPLIDRIEVQPETGYLGVGDTTTFYANCYLGGDFVNGVPISWYSSDNKIATIDQQTGEVTSLSPGMTMIKAAYDDGQGTIVSDTAVLYVNASGEGGGDFNVYPGPAGGITTVNLKAWNAIGIPVLIWIFKYDGTWDELLNIGMSTDGAGVLPFLVYGTVPTGEDGQLSGSPEGLFLIDSSPWSVNVQVALQAGHYIAVIVPIIPDSGTEGGNVEGVTEQSDDGGVNPENFLVKEFNVSAGEVPWVRTMEMTCYRVWVNENDDFQFIFWYPYRDNNWVKIYDANGKMVFETDMPYDNPNLIVDLPDGTYTVKTFNLDKANPIQTFTIGK
jgi:hypothetical protein